MKLSAEEVVAIVDECTEDWETIEEKIVGHKRWEVIYQRIIKNKKDGKFYRITFPRGATEAQESEYYEMEIPEVCQKEVVVKEWFEVGE
jgi:hypothetical protein